MGTKIDAVSWTKCGGTDAPTSIRRQGRRRIAAVLALAAIGFAASAGWVHAKAQLAQWLLDRSWHKSRVDGGQHRPWPWADTSPVARLHPPGAAGSQVVLSGDSGRILAFAPGWAPASAAPGTPGTTVVSGHRDTHFAWLRSAAVGDLVALETRDGSQSYEIVDLRVADSSRERITLDTDTDGLLLVTCWPFDAVATGGPLRYVATARPLR